MSYRARTIIAHHQLLTGYGHWLMNDLRGSGSIGFHDDKFVPLGPIHYGRKPEHLLPAREELRAFYHEADELLTHPRLWFDDPMRQAIGQAVGEVIRSERYTCYAFAALSNHIHMAIRRHRDDALTMLRKINVATARVVRGFPLFGDLHPVWANRPYKVFMYTPEDVWMRIHYIEANPEKEGLPHQRWDFVTAYDNWPLHKR